MDGFSVKIGDFENASGYQTLGALHCAQDAISKRRGRRLRKLYLSPRPTPGERLLALPEPVTERETWLMIVGSAAPGFSIRSCCTRLPVPEGPPSRMRSLDHHIGNDVEAIATNLPRQSLETANSGGGI